MARAVVLMLDSLGIGASVDADRFGDDGADTFGHIAMACARGDADRPGERSGALAVPNLSALGLVHAAANSRGQWPDGLPVVTPVGAWGYAVESSRGKDTPSGHWEMAGLPVEFDWGYFPDTVPCFPSQLIDRLIAEGNLPGVLGNCHASGTAIIDELGEEHIASGASIVYTSADSVFQIAAHEERFGLARLHALCAALAPRLHQKRVGRVIARPFTGSVEVGFQRTVNRRDYAIGPPAPTLLHWVQAAGRQVHAIGKIGDIFSMSGIDTLHTGTDNTLMQTLFQSIDSAENGSLTVANFVEFDSLYGHRRDVAGYARALEWFDAQVGLLIPKLRPNDFLLLTADHGNDPTWPGTDHTRERVPVLGVGGPTEAIGLVDFEDVAASIAAHLGVSSQGFGKSFL